MLQHNNASGGGRPLAGRREPRHGVTRKDFYTKISRDDKTYNAYLLDTKNRNCVYRVQGRCLESFCLDWSTPFCGGCTCFILSSIGLFLFFAYLYLFEITNIEIGPDHFFFFCLLLSLEVFLIVGGCILCAYTSPASAETKSAGRRRNPYGDAPGRLRRSAGDRTGGVGRTGAVENGFAGMRQPATSGSAGLRRVDAPLNEQGTTTLIAEKNNDDGTAIEVYSEDEYEETVADDEDDYMSPNGDIADNSDFDSEEDWMSARGEDDYDPVDHIDYSIYGDV